jgi:hypothetical protein
MRSALAFELACALLGFILGLLADVGAQCGGGKADSTQET